jgi:hypothetical protein
VVKVAVKTHQGEVVFLSGHILISIVEVKVELLYYANKALCISRFKVYQANRPSMNASSTKRSNASIWFNLLSTTPMEWEAKSVMKRRSDGTWSRKWPTSPDLA